MARKLVIDFFAGGGGASEGLAQALGRGPDIAINHDAEALEMHAANHPETRHVREDVWKTDLRKLVGKRKVGLAWFSPDCRHFSRAKGGKPVSKGVRSLAWIVVKAAAQIKPDVIILENVREYAEWGPLVPRWRCRGCGWKGTEGQVVHKRNDKHHCPSCDSRKISPTEDLVPDPKRKGLTFKKWAGRLRNLGYQLQYKTLDAADFGAPTHRKRLFLIARRDGKPIVWPQPTHADPRKLDRYGLFERPKPYRTAAEIIDWELPCLSIFASPAEAKAWAKSLGLKGVPQRPLKEKTLRRIALGIKRYVLDAAKPFIVKHYGGVVGHDLERPLGTVTAVDHHGLVTPYITPITHTGERRSHAANEPLPTVTRAHRGEFGLVAPTLIQIGYGERDGQAPRVPGLDKPLGTAVNVRKHALVAGLLMRYNGQKGNESRCQQPTEPISTVDTQNRFGVVAGMLTKFYGTSTGQPLDEPAPVTTAGGQHTGLAAANLIRVNHGEKQWNGADEPLCTVTSQGNKFGVVYTFLAKYFGTAIAQERDKPLGTLTTKGRYAVVKVEVRPGQFADAVAVDVPGAGPCIIADIALRMLRPRELARAQGFRDSYVLTGSTSNQVAKIGNSVPPVMAQALAAANYRTKRTVAA